jgi:hypothetical protein
MYLTEAEANRRMAAEVGDIPVPPKFASADFLKGDYSRLRGKLDVPKERFILYPHAEREADPTPVVGWAGWDHLQRAQALATYYLAMRDKEGWAVERLTPLLAGLLDLVPWLRQWHNAIDPSVGQGLGDYYAGFAEEEMRRFGLTAEAVRAWTPSLTTSKPRGRGRRAEATLESGR